MAAENCPTETVVQPDTVSLELPVSRLNAFFLLFQKGVTVPAVVGTPLKNLLCDQLAIPLDYVTQRITTIFLNNSPVDDLNATVIPPDAAITLSAAMPGLVGATMRRGGYYAAMRQGISSQINSGDAVAIEGKVRIKLFNLLLAEVAPLILARGIIIEPHELEDLKLLPEVVKEISSHTFPILMRVRFSE